MYSVLLAAALTAGTAEVPAWHHGCYGCMGCYGCCGGNAFSCNGCCGGCWGCCGGCWGCCGGCWGCSGCYGVACYGCCGGCCGGWSCWGCCGGCWGCCGGTVVVPVTTVHVVKPVYVVPVVDHHHHASAAPAVKADTPALVKVKLPADATLYVDGMKTDLTSETRTFKTPALENGRDYYYTIRVEAVRDGEKVSQNQRVIVRGGQTSEVSFGEFPVAAKSEPAKEPPAKAPARITVKLPSDARLYVDGVLCPQKAVGVRSFETPKLETGVTYAYTLKAEVVRNGQPVVQTKRVEMQAGKEVSIDFGDLTTVQAASR